MDAQEVLQKTVALYASLTSYLDTGHVRTRHATTGLVSRLWFSTLYQKPSLFRFTFFSPHPHPPLGHLVTQHVAGFDGVEGYSVMKRPDDVPSSKSAKTLKLAVAGATGISAGSAFTIGGLLLPEMGGSSILALHNPRFDGEAEIDSATCHVIRGQLPNGNERECWIEKDTLLLRKIITLLETSRSEEVRENIRVNEELDSRLFAA